MIKAEQIPDEVIRAFVNDITYGSEHVPGAIAAAINAWPGMQPQEWYGAGPRIILPLPQDNTNAEG